jgi:glyoxylase-like metal-dependent hydrolase (beta-lactamase superfamily II)
VYEVVALRYGTRETRKRDCYLDYDSYGEPDQPLLMDYFLWVIRNGAGAIVVDSGFNEGSGARRGRTCLVPPVEALRRLGIEPDEVATVILTHLHYDHTGNVAAFPNAELVVQRSELEFWTSDEARGPQFASHAEPEDVAWIAAGRLRLLDGDEAVAPGVDAFCVGGHSPGQTVLLVEGDRGPVVLASDAVHYYEELELERPFAIYHDLDAMRAAYATVRELARPAAAVVPGHDPEVMRRFLVLDDGLAVQLA